jgi:hypothetical protein
MKAVVVDVNIPHGPHGEKQGLDDFRAAGGNVAELMNVAIIEAITAERAARAQAEVERDGLAARVEPLVAQLREHKLADQMRRQEAFSAGEVEIARYYARSVASALSRGETRVPVWSEETRKVTGQSPSTATRFHTAYRRLQADPEIRATLPYVLETETKDRKDYIRLVVTAPPAEPSERTTAAILAPLARLYRPEDRKPHGGARWSCPDPAHDGGPVIETTQKHYRCGVGDCPHSWSPPATVVRHPGKDEPFHDETVAAPVVEIDGGLFAVETQGGAAGDVGTGPFHDETLGERTQGRQDETVNRPVSFVSRDDLAWAAGKPWPDSGPFHHETVAPGSDGSDAPPKADTPAPPPPVPDPSRPAPAPRRHLAYWARPDWRERAAAADKTSNQQPPLRGEHFAPSPEWQVVPDGYPCPPGGEFRMDFQTGKNWARWPSQEGVGT